MISETFLKRLEKYPYLQNRFESILSVIENETGEFETADDAEMMAIAEVKKLGSEVLHAWADAQHKKKKEQVISNNPELIHHSKKNCIG